MDMGLPKAYRVKLNNHQRSDAGRFCSSMHKWGLAPFSNCVIRQLTTSSPSVPQIGHPGNVSSDGIDEETRLKIADMSLVGKVYEGMVVLPTNIKSQ